MSRNLKDQVGGGFSISIGVFYWFLGVSSGVWMVSTIVCPPPVAFPAKLQRLVPSQVEELEV